MDNNKGQDGLSNQEKIDQLAMQLDMGGMGEGDLARWIKLVTNHVREANERMDDLGKQVDDLQRQIEIMKGDRIE